MAPRMLLGLLLSAVVVASKRPATTFSSNSTSRPVTLSTYQLTGPSSNAPPEKCPPCFNCQLPAFACGQYGECNEYDGQCKCPAGWGGIDCLIPQCDSLADGDHRRLREGGACECKEGWGGINCNVCKTNQACGSFPVLGGIPTNDEDEVDPEDMRCYTGGETVFNNHQMCNVTNRKIIDQVGADRPVQVTFSCDTGDSTCAFQFWVDQVESFYCSLDTCTSSTTIDYARNTTTYACDHIKCSCIANRFICGEDGSVNIDDFLKEEIRGPATFSCRTGDGCRFEEPAMNELISDIFGDPYITLDCEGGECLHFSQVPGYVRPPKPDSTKWVALSAAGACLVVILVSAILWYAGRASGGEFGHIRLADDEQSRLMNDHVPATLHFENLSYTLGSRILLDNISGTFKPGQVCAIMGASGAGKSTFLDILARKAKRGQVGGTTYVNGREVANDKFKAVTGFVDQEDTLMSTLTVYETVLYSALLRLPRDMSLEAKKFRTLETLNELGILGIKDSRIGSSDQRSISGGEKRRVSIACELVTSPSILFLDEPTSGLDAYNAYNVVECLVTLAKNYNRTVVFTIHQPRSNIVALFDQLVLLCQGKLVYSGDFNKCQSYFAEIGQSCPPGFNIADFLIDMTVQASLEGDDSPTLDAESPIDDGESSSRESTELATRSASGNFIKRKTSQLLEAMSLSSAHKKPHQVLSAKLLELAAAYASSSVAREIRIEFEALQRATESGASAGLSGELPDVAVETTLLRGRKRAGYGTQFRILSGRAFKNLYRDPALLAAHYVSSIGLALICGLFFHNVTNDISGFQNRLGLFFFTLALFGFSCLSSLGLFANERILFIRERANGYYSTFTYFSSKVLFDILPLRVVPPLVFGAIVYPLVGLVPSVVSFWKFMLILVLFNLTTAMVVLFLSIAIANTSVAGLVGTLVMLFNLMFTGLLINRESVPIALRWLHTLSFFHAAFEALAVNELRYLHLTETKYGVELDVPAALILSTFGLHAQSFWWPNTALLGIFFGVLITASYLTLQFFVKEKR
ncbi:unnamed protein product [Mycena citricolor]|uniref:ABC transporter domain-containing protein n=1 Tax=Mycena citricolor TaxID=2018698 RepID=A0AAD2Q2A9_9AGAR|nr:unnamed protein product [Mycena citricolor]